MPKKKRFFVQKKMRMRKSKALIIDYRIKKKDSCLFNKFKVNQHPSMNSYHQQYL